MKFVFTCVLCDEGTRHGHHVTGRHLDHGQMDVLFTVPVCHMHHVLLHEDLRHAGLDFPVIKGSAPELLERRLRRLALLHSRIAEFLPQFPWIALLIPPLIAWADELAAFVDALDAWDLGWRDAEGFR